MNALFVLIAAGAVVLAVLSHCMARRNAARFRLLAEGTTDLVSLHDRDHEWRFIYASPAFRRITGYAPHELIGRCAEELIHPADLAQLLQSRVRFATGALETVRVECRVRNKAGNWIWLEIEKTSSRPFVKKGQVLVTARDISAKKSIEEQLRKLEQRDPTTGLLNRAAFIVDLQETLERSAESGKSVALLCIDVNGLKLLNDLHGNAVGDEALRLLASRLNARALGRYRVARFGDDEFTVLLEQDDDVLFDAPRAVTRMVEDLTQPLEITGEPVYLAVSAGLAVFPLHAENTQGLLAAAHAATQAAKAEGGNTWRVFRAEHLRDRQRNARTLADLRRAYDEKRLVLHYQPKVDIKTGACTGFEALLRISTAEGVQPAGSYIHAAEESGFIHLLTEWVIGAAFEQSKKWLAQGLTLPIAVNISVKSLQADSGFLPFIEKALSKDPSIVRCLELEITESVVVADLRACLNTLTRLRWLGFSLHLDDFGAGHSSLSYLCSLPFHTVKIDRSFIDGLPRTSPDVVKGILHLAASLGMSVVAEGVETAAQLTLLSSLGCHQAQGFLFSKAMPADDATAFAVGYAGRHGANPTAHAPAADWLAALDDIPNISQLPPGGQ